MLKNQFQPREILWNKQKQIYYNNLFRSSLAHKLIHFSYKLTKTFKPILKILQGNKWKKEQQLKRNSKKGQKMQVMQHRNSKLVPINQQLVCIHYILLLALLSEFKIKKTYFTSLYSRSSNSKRNPNPINKILAPLIAVIVLNRRARLMETTLMMAITQARVFLRARE